MSELLSVDADEFALMLLEEAKRFLEKARSVPIAESGQQAFLHSALLLAFCSFEAHVNAMAEEFASEAATLGLTVHEVGLLREKDVQLDNGRFEVRDQLRMVRLEDKIRFLSRRFARSAMDYSESWWTRVSDAERLRNRLTHPKGMVPLRIEDVENALRGVIGTLDALYHAIYQKPFPTLGLDLDSTLDF